MQPFFRQRSAWTTVQPGTLPRAPVLDWSSFSRDAGRPVGVASVQDLQFRAFTTSGRAAIFQALRQMSLPPGSTVLLPTYHCPTMVAPVLETGHVPAYYAIGHDGLPDVEALERRGGGTGARAMIAAHYFGLPRSMGRLRRWCDDRGILLIEDCAHCFFGVAGDRPVGAWGDYATASLSKFFPVPEAGLLGSAHRVIVPLALRPPTARAQIKGGIDVLEHAVCHGRLKGLRQPLGVLFALKNRRPRAPIESWPAMGDAEEGLMADCDMARVEEAPLGASIALTRHLPRIRIVRRRRENYEAYAQAFANVRGARPLFVGAGDGSGAGGQPVPYVFPLWVNDGDRVYHGMRALGLPVFRWDRIWPGTPALAGDAGPIWSRHVLQLLCHQDLQPQDIDHTVRNIRKLLA